MSATARRLALAALLIALAFKAMFPAGWMPGHSLSQPIVLCPDGGDGQAMADMRTAHRGHEHGPAPHPSPDHPCAFAGLGAATLAALREAPASPPEARADSPLPAKTGAIAPGRGLAAPPPPSHAPPALRA